MSNSKIHIIIAVLLIVAVVLVVSGFMYFQYTSSIDAVPRTAEQTSDKSSDQALPDRVAIEYVSSTPIMLDNLDAVDTASSTESLSEESSTTFTAAADLDLPPPPRSPASEDDEVATEQQIAEAGELVDVGSQPVDSLPISDLPQVPESLTDTMEPASFTQEDIPVFTVEAEAQAASADEVEADVPAVIAPSSFVAGPDVGNGEQDMTSADAQQMLEFLESFDTTPPVVVGSPTAQESDGESLDGEPIFIVDTETTLGTATTEEGIETTPPASFTPGASLDLPPPPTSGDPDA